MNKPKTKIEAIKVIRDLPFWIEEKVSESGYKFQAIRVNLSLNDAKDLVEAIMAIEPVSNAIVVENLKQSILDANKKAESWKQAFFNLRYEVAKLGNVTAPEEDNY